MHSEGLNLKVNIIPKTLMARFTVPPFSILDGKQGYWQKRKRAWLRLGIKSELGRGEVVSTVGSGLAESQDRLDKIYKNKKLNNYHQVEGEKSFVKLKSERDKKKQMASTTCCATEWMKRGTDAGGSVFDPVVCELMYKWFCPPIGQIVDPFAGGSVRGVVAALLGFQYWGCDLRSEQIEANKAQAIELCPENKPEWVSGDSKIMLRQAPMADFIFSCPPYGDLEVYSDDPSDISNMEFDDFLSVYRSIIKRSCKRLKDDRFACFVVGDYRDKNGHYRNFVSHTIQAFLDAGMQLYNEIIFATPVGSLPIRTSKQFDAGRKVGKMHQNILIFIKGDSKKATELIVNKED